MSVISTYREAVRLFIGRAVRPIVRVAVTEGDGVCDVPECGTPSDLTITFVDLEEMPSNPQLRCLEHWGSAWSIMTEAGCKIEYSEQALKWIMWRLGASVARSDSGRRD